MDNFENYVNKIVKCIKEIWENRTAIKIILAFLGLIGLLSTTTVLLQENVDMNNAVEQWYKQLPENHWLKEDNQNIWNTNTYTYAFMQIFQLGISTAKTGSKLLNVTLQQENDYALQFLGKAMEKQDDRNKQKYQLYDSDTDKKVRTIKIRAGEETDVKMFYETTELMLDFTEDDYIQEIQPNGNSINIANRIVFSYVDDPTIATIYNGKITGLKKGKTVLYLYCNGYKFEYKIKVKK